MKMSKERRKPVAQNEKGKVEDITPDAIPEVLRELPKNEPAPLDKLTSRGGTKYEKKSVVKQKAVACLYRRGGYDTVEIGYFGHWRDFPALKLALESALNAVNEKAAGAEYVALGDLECLLYPEMAKIGPKYYFVLESNGVKIYIPRTLSRNTPNIQLRYGGVALIGRDFFGLHFELLKRVESFGFVPVKEILQRIDLQIMLRESTKSIIEILLNCCFACRAKGEEFYRLNRMMNSYGIGKDTKLRIYDKVAEINAKGADPAAKSLLAKHSIGDWLKSKKPITRFEFQLRKESLKRLGINDVNDLLAKEAGLVEYLTKWFRLLESPKKRGNNGKEHRIWTDTKRLLHECFPGSEGVREPVKWERRKAGACDVKVLMAIAKGCLSEIVARNSGEQNSDTEAEIIVQNILGPESKEIVQQAKKKSKRREIGKGVTIGDHEAEKQE